MNPGHQDKIRQLAHRLWEDEGRPEGRADAHWAQAEDMVKAAQAVKTARPKAAVKTARPKAAAKTAKPKAPSAPKAPAKAKA